MKSFDDILDLFRKESETEREKGKNFEKLIQRWFLSDPRYAHVVTTVWLWRDFPSKADFGTKDLGIDLVAKTDQGEYWAIQCKCYQENATIDARMVSGFIAESSRLFTDETTHLKTAFSNLIWVSTTSHWGPNAEEKIKNQRIPFTRINLFELRNSAVDWGKLLQGESGALTLLPGKHPLPHQIEAIKKTHEYFKSHNRGKLIMACGTGKTYTSLKIAEQETKGQGLVLYLVPSIALLGQGMNSWMEDTSIPIKPVCVCSDEKASNLNDDTDTSIVDTPYPATTKVEIIIRHLLKYEHSKGLVVVFSTYQSIEVIAQAQKAILKQTGGAFGKFNMIVCDEAHRTTGARGKDKAESNFTKIHNNSFIQGEKRLYMTATPRYYKENVKATAKEKDVFLWSMDDENIFGEEIYRIGFGKAVSLGLLTDYKVLVLTISEDDLSDDMKESLKGNKELNLDDASKLIGCINGLSKRIKGDNGVTRKEDPGKMHRAVAFCSTIRKGRRSSSIASMDFAEQFPQLAKYYKEHDVKPEEQNDVVDISVKHIDGGMNAEIRAEALDWLKDKNIGENECRILSNVRCLSEGVDVPALDAVIFVTARDSQVDVVQSVGRVMRSFHRGEPDEKKYGYIIVPVVVPPDVEPNIILDNNDRFKVVWDILNALRAHDEEFNATINKIALNKNKPSKIIVAGVPRGSFSMLGGDGNRYPDAPDNGEDVLEEPTQEEINTELTLRFGELQDGIYARMVEKVGDRLYWENWASQVGDIAQKFIYRINLLIKGGKHKKEFDSFLNVLQQDLNPSITADQAIEMLAQHMITQPVFDALFQNYDFIHNNTVSQSMQRMLELLENEQVDKDTKTLSTFYENVRQNVGKIDNLEGKQTIIKTLYEKFFKKAFPLTVSRLGIVYTPIECVDFIIRSVDDILKKEFSCSLTDKNVHILDPFVGTGTFITRLLQSGLIRPEDMERKYRYEIHCNEIILLAYYIADVNIESVFHELTHRKEYLPYDNICLTDTFQTTEQKDPVFDKSWFEGNSEIVEKQLRTPIRVIIGNPPYSIGQKSANDNAQNQSYPHLDGRITETYVKESEAGLNKSTYDLYIKAFRWASDRISKNDDGGIIGFISNGAWIDANANDGFRKCLEREFSTIYVLNLRGNARTSGEQRRKEKDNVFGSGSRTPIAITLLVKKSNQSKDNKATIYYHDIGDYLSREQKLEMVKNFKSISSRKLDWTVLHPNSHGDWTNLRNEGFADLIPLAPEKKFDAKSQSGFIVNGPAIASGRDVWVYNFSKNDLGRNIGNMIAFYNQQREGYQTALKENPKFKVEEFIDTDAHKISWTRALRNAARNGKKYDFNAENIAMSLYRPFCIQYLYFDEDFIESPGLSRKLFPTPQIDNLVICLSCKGSSKEFSVMISNVLPDYHFVGDTNAFPLYWYEEKDYSKESKDMFSLSSEDKYVRHDGISDWMLKEVRNRLGNNRKITKEIIFYYVYGLLHSQEYCSTFAIDLKKSLPRIPIVEDYSAFMDFYYAGKMLADLHLNYEQVEASPDVSVTDNYTGTDEYEHYAVQKMTFPSKKERSSIIYNEYIRIDNIPEQAYDYVVNGKSAIEWVMERYAVTVNKVSLIKNDPNEWSREHYQPRYILDLLLSIINVSCQTVDIVNRLPKLKFEGSNVMVLESGKDLRPIEEENPNEYTGSDTLRLSIKQVYLDEIIAGRKKVEYREIFNEYTAKKYLATDKNGSPLCDSKCTVEGKIYHPDEYNNGHFPFVARPYRRIRFSVGQFGDKATVEITNITFSVSKPKSNGLVIWQIEYHLGKISGIKRK
jgi:predicted helicase